MKAKEAENEDAITTSLKAWNHNMMARPALLDVFWMYFDWLTQ
jgi:hypothetical protein